MDENEPPAQEAAPQARPAPQLTTGPTAAERGALTPALVRDGMALATDPARLGLLAGPVPYDATVVGIDDDGSFIINPDLLYGP